MSDIKDNSKEKDKVNGRIEEPVDAEETSEEAIGDPDDLDAESNFHTEAPAYSARDDGNINSTHEYLINMDIDV